MRKSTIALLSLCTMIAGSALTHLLFNVKIAEIVIALLFVVAVWCTFKLVALAKGTISVYIAGLEATKVKNVFFQDLIFLYYSPHL